MGLGGEGGSGAALGAHPSPFALGASLSQACIFSFFPDIFETDWSGWPSRGGEVSYHRKSGAAAICAGRIMEGEGGREQERREPPHPPLAVIFEFGISVKIIKFGLEARIEDESRAVFCHRRFEFDRLSRKKPVPSTTMKF